MRPKLTQVTLRAYHSYPAAVLIAIQALQRTITLQGKRSALVTANSIFKGRK